MLFYVVYLLGFLRFQFKFDLQSVYLFVVTNYTAPVQLVIHANVNFLYCSYIANSYLTLPKCRLLCEVDYESMPSSSIFRCSL